MMRSRFITTLIIGSLLLQNSGCLCYAPVGARSQYVNSVPIEYSSVAVTQFGYEPHQIAADRHLVRAQRNNIALPYAVPFVAGMDASTQQVTFNNYSEGNLSSDSFAPFNFWPDSQFQSAAASDECGCQSCRMNPDSSTSFHPTPVQPVSVEVPIPDSPQAPVTIPKPPVTETPADQVALGRKLFFDDSLSHPVGQSCATCHSPETGFADPDTSLPVSRGAISDRFGSRNTPSAAYASFSPPLHYDEADENWVGGLFWDGRANTLSDQAKGPPLNPLEMNIPDKRTLVASIRTSEAAELFRIIHGTGSLDESHAEQVTDQMADAIAAFESSVEMNAFTSKYDAVLKGKATLTSIEAKGLELFNGKAGCAACHPANVIGDEPGPLFTDFTYDNVGVPKNNSNPYLTLSRELNPEGADFVDHGLATTVAKIDPAQAKEQDGKFKVPSLRNVARTAPYGHNGYFKTLKDIVHFYNTRDLTAAMWEEPEIPETVNHYELGDLGLSDEEEDAIIAFLLTLSDGWDASDR